MEKNKSNNVTPATADFFFEQCVGMYSGHMAGIPNNPVLYGFCKAHGVSTESEFADFLREIAAQLDKFDDETPF